MQSTLELSELEELVGQLDPQITEVALSDNAEAPSVLLCSLLDCDDDCSHCC